MRYLDRCRRVGTSVQPSGKVETRSVSHGASFFLRSTTFYGSKLRLRTSRIYIHYFTQPSLPLINIRHISIIFRYLSEVEVVIMSYRILRQLSLIRTTTQLSQVTHTFRRIHVIKFIRQACHDHYEQISSSILFPPTQRLRVPV